MASDTTFENLWKRLLVHAPNLPIPLAQEFINTSYSRILATCDWSQLRVDNQFFIPDRYDTGTVSITQGASVVTGVGTTWTAAMVGRQIYFGGEGPFYDISTVDSATQITLAQTYKDSTISAGTYGIDLIYIEMPSDFMDLLIVRDMELNWKLRLNITQEMLDTWDARRTTAGTGWVMATAPPLTTGLVRFELWPRPGIEKLFAYAYVKKPALLTGTQAPAYPVRGDVIREGALAELSLWPGIDEQNKNPYFSLDSHRRHEERFWKGVYALERQDQNIRQTNIMYEDFESLPWAPIDAAFWQSHGGIY